MMTSLWNLSTAVRGYQRAYMPTNILLDLIRTRRSFKWGVVAALVLVPSYLFAASFITELLRDGGPGLLNLLVLLFVWNSLKFAVAVPISLILLARARLSERSVRRGTCGYKPGRPVGPWTTSPGG
jgi:hypothetical protein